MIQKCNHEFCDLRIMSTSFHQIWRRFDVRTRMLALEAKRWIPWVKLKIWSKNLNSNRWARKLNWLCEITKKHYLIQNQVNNLSFDLFGWNANESEVGWSYGGHEENDLKNEKICALKWIEEYFKCWQINFMLNESVLH